MDIWKDTLEREFSAVGLKKRGRAVKIAEHQTGNSIKSIDKKRNALSPGKRVSRTGKIYYEYRKNRSDLKGENI
jgi:hypothetical protein